MWVYIWGKSRLVEFWVELGEHYQEIMGKRANAPEILYKLVGVQRHIKEGVPVLCMNCLFQDYLPSPRAKRAGPKGPCAESARAVREAPLKFMLGAFGHCPFSFCPPPPALKRALWGTFFWVVFYNFKRVHASDVQV